MLLLLSKGKNDTSISYILLASTMATNGVNEARIYVAADLVRLPRARFCPEIYMRGEETPRRSPFYLAMHEQSSQSQRERNPNFRYTVVLRELYYENTVYYTIILVQTECRIWYHFEAVTHGYQDDKNTTRGQPGQGLRPVRRPPDDRKPRNISISDGGTTASNNAVQLSVHETVRESLCTKTSRTTREGVSSESQPAKTHNLPRAASLMSMQQHIQGILPTHAAIT